LRKGIIWELKEIPGRRGVEKGRTPPKSGRPRKLGTQGRIGKGFPVLFNEKTWENKDRKMVGKGRGGVSFVGKGAAAKEKKEKKRKSQKNNKPSYGRKRTLRARREVPGRINGDPHHSRTREGEFTVVRTEQKNFIILERRETRKVRKERKKTKGRFRTTGSRGGPG